MPRMLLFVLVVISLTVFGCSRGAARDRLKKAASSSPSSPAAGNEVASNDPFTPDADDGPNGAKYLQAVKDFYLAVGEGKYDKAYDMLSPHALHDVHPYQFSSPNDPDQAKTNEPPRIPQLAKEEFVKRMTEAVAKFGPPRKVVRVYIDEMDPKVLAGKGDNLSVMFAIGMMSKSVPVEIRKAAIRGEIRCNFTPEAKKETMEELDQTAEQLDSEENDVYPYFKMKTVLLEENSALKIGYFEVVGPSILD